MTITPQLLEAFLLCPTKCWLRAANEAPTGNEYVQWSAARGDAFRAEGTKRLVAACRESEWAMAPAAENLKAADRRLAVDVSAQAANIETRIAALERVPSAGRGKATQFVPIRFFWTNKFGRHEKLLLAFDALVLSETLGRDVTTGKIIHGDDHATLKVKVPALVNDVRKLVEKAAAMLSNPSPPDLVLNRHCAECEFQARCRQKGVEQDDLSLLSSMSEQERKDLRGRGIFTVTQLSYTFRPRRRPKHLRDKREKYHHSLKALAMREKKTYVVGSPEFKIEGTPVYLDVEALPDTDFYYLIGVRVNAADGIVHRSFWADEIGDMAKFWGDFLDLLTELDRPCLIHYGSFETIFLKRMRARFGDPQWFQGRPRLRFLCCLRLVQVPATKVPDSPRAGLERRHAGQPLRRRTEGHRHELQPAFEDHRRGLKKHFLRKHVAAVDRFYRKVIKHDYQSPAALTCVDRFERNRNKLFTFLNYDSVPWNNNNAEHAIKAFARLRDVIEGSSTEKGIKEYLTLLSVCQTCKYIGVDFLDFLRSGEKDVHAFAESRRKRPRAGAKPPAAFDQPSVAPPAAADDMPAS